MYRNTINSKCYIGKCHGDIKRRQNEHVGGRGSQLLKQAFDKYGIENFTFEILHDGIFGIFLDAYEIEAIQKFNTVAPNGYNLTFGGDGGIPSEETRRKQSIWQKGKKKRPHTTKTRRKMSKSHTGKKKSPEHIRKMSESKKGKPSWHKGKKRSKETCEKIGRASKGRISVNKGKPRTQKERENISRAVRRALKGKPNPKKGIPLSQETRDKISQTKRDNPPSKETREKMGRANRGKTISKEIRKKMSLSKIGKFQSSDKTPAREFFFSLSPNMPLSEKRRLLCDRFPQRGVSTIYKWVRQWESEKTS